MNSTHDSDDASDRGGLADAGPTRQESQESQDSEASQGNQGNQGNVEDSINVLLVEDSPGDARLIVESLKDATATPDNPVLHLRHAARLSEGIPLLQGGEIKAALLDLSLPDSSGLDTYVQAQAAAPQVPIIVLSGLDDEVLAAQAVRSGAQDYLVKGQADGALILRSIRYAVARKQAEHERATASAAQAAQARAEALAAENARLYRAAQEAITVRDEFLSVAAHELKTPLTTLRGTAQLTLRRFDKQGTLSAEQVHTSLETIERQSRRLSRIVNHLLDISRLQEGKLALQPEPVDLLKLVEQAVAVAQTTTTRHQLQVEAQPGGEADKDDFMMQGDPLRLEQVLANLLDNAIKYSPQGGPITVSVGHAGPGTLAFEVRDRGLGIPPELRSQVFERYFHAHPAIRLTGANAMAGMGLGLFISREIVELHHGHIEARFPPEGGTAMQVTLPVDGGASIG